MSLPAAAPPDVLAPEKRAVLHVRFFGPIRTLVPAGGWEMPWCIGGTADEFWSGLLARFPEIGAMRASIRLARNGEFLAEGEQLLPGDEVALLPPVSGG